jgi:phage-related protein
MADGRIIIDTQIDGAGAEKDIKSLSGKLGSLAKTGATAIAGLVAAASAAVAGLVTLSVKQYAEFEQLTGGVETLFKDSADLVKRYAANAYETAGLSANEYMNTITGFSASLLQGLGGDTEKAARIGHQAILDMSDNANKMGTSMEMIQNAYQGFAKQNYTMLDNLKLGFGGTKEEMQRLLVEAEKISGVKYNISNFSDIIEAIHVIQNEMGITGTTAKEAATTISGSFNMLKSAWSNILTGMASDTENFDDLVNDLVYSLQTFGGNILPRIKIAIGGITKLFNSLVQELPSLINNILPELLNSGIDIVKNLISGIQEGLPSLINTALDIMMSLVNGVIEVMPMLLEVGLQALITLGQGIAENLPTLIPTLVNLVISMCDMIIENLPLILDVAIDIILALVEGLVTALPTLISEVPRIINEFSNAIYSALPQILKAGVDILLMLIKGLIDSIPTLIANIPQIIMAIVNVFTLYNWTQLGKSLITWIGDGIKGMGGSLVSWVKGLGQNAVDGIVGIFKQGGSIGSNFISWITNGIRSMFGNIVGNVRNLGSSILSTIKNILGWDSAASIGSNLIKGIWNGISNMTGWILNLIGGFADSVIGSIKGFFGIHSPSRIMRDLIGTNIVKGIGVGIDIETPNLEKDIDSNMSDLVAKMQTTVDYETAMTTARVVTKNNSSDGNSINSSEGIPEGSVFILKNEIDGQSIGESVYKVVNGKLALAGKRVR